MTSCGKLFLDTFARSKTAPRNVLDATACSDNNDDIFLNTLAPERPPDLELTKTRRKGIVSVDSVMADAVGVDCASSMLSVAISGSLVRGELHVVLSSFWNGTS